MGTYNVHAGHCPQGQGASGAVGILQESVEDRIVKNEVIRLLRAEGNTVYDCTHLSICTVYRNYGSGVYCLHAVHTASDFVVYDHCCYYGRILGGICGYVWLGKSSGALEEIL